MTAEVDWALAQLKDVADSQPFDHELRRVNRDESRLLEGDVTSIKGELTKANYVGVTHVDTDRQPVGTEYDVEREVVLGVRVTGFTAAKHGHIDPQGEDGVPFTGSNGLVKQCKDAFWSERQWPDANPDPDIYYKHLELQNEANTSHQWADFYRADWDVVFDGYEEL